MKGILIVIILNISYLGFSQPYLSVDKVKIRIGDQLKASIRVDLSNGKEWNNLKEVWRDSLAGVEVIGEPEVSSGNPQAYSATWTLAVFDTGIVTIPSMPVIIGSQGKNDTFYTNDVQINVTPVEPDSTGLSGLKEIYFEPFKAGYYYRYIPHAIVILLLIGGMIYWLRQGKSNQPVTEEIIIPLLPHEWAFSALDQLAEKKLWQKGEVKEHYSELTSILREYLERRYAIHAKEQTSDEILAQLRQLQLNPTLLFDTEELISIADLIKFAKADPGMNIHAAAIERIRSFILETIPQVQQAREEAGITTEDDGVE